MDASPPIVVDGSRGEGGGQILRTSLALSMITGRPLRMANIRAGRAKPGLRKQHVACVEAARLVSRATVRGAKVESTVLEFTPSPIDAWPADDLALDIGSAGSTSLVVQTILLPVIVASARRPGVWRATVQGGTHNPMAPPFDFLARVFVPQLVRMGADVTITCPREGFVPTGGGELVVEVGPSTLAPLAIVDAAPVIAHRAVAIVSRLPTHVADRERRAAAARLAPAAVELETRALDRGGPANVFLLEVERADGVRELVSQFGEKRLRAETVAERACDDLAAYLAHGHPVGEHLADQLLLPMALAGGGSFRTGPLSLHATTNIDTIRMFLDVPISVTELPGGALVAIG
ncbi:MAG: RNA 3'-terminal phosphate cyclase [Proteobacteria bacterium]|nr:RNA 3'-terminal phosphate cyclase [Pseudomonadota bacterium]